MGEDMVETKRIVMGLFREEGAAASVVSEAPKHAWAVEKVYSPIPSQTLSDAMKLKTSRVGYFTLAGGILGFLFGFVIAVFTATRWSLVVSGKPVVALVPFFIVGFEFTILFAVFGNVIGMLTQAKLPRLETDTFYDERCSGEHFGVLVSCPAAEVNSLVAFFKARGGEVREYHV